MLLFSFANQINFPNGRDLRPPRLTKIFPCRSGAFKLLGKYFPALEPHMESANQIERLEYTLPPSSPPGVCTFLRGNLSHRNSPCKALYSKRILSTERVRIFLPCAFGRAGGSTASPCAGKEAIDLGTEAPAAQCPTVSLKRDR